MSGNLESLIAAPRASRTTLVILFGFTAALFWWIGIAGVANAGGGAQIFLTVPILATIGTVLLAASGRRGQKAKHIDQAPSAKTKHANQRQSHKARGALPATRRSWVVLSGFTAALCWWIGITGVASTGGGAQVFLAIPLWRPSEPF